MFKVLFALHLLFAIFAIGPLVHAATTAARGVRTGDAVAMGAAARTLRIYAAVSVAVVVLGMALMSVATPYGDHAKAGEFGQLWIWLSLLLWVVAMAIVFALLAPTLSRGAANGDVATLTGRVAASGGVVALIFVAIVFLMVYQPGK